MIRHSPSLKGQAVQSNDFTGLTSAFRCLYSEVGWWQHSMKVMLACES